MSKLGVILFLSLCLFQCYTYSTPLGNELGSNGNSEVNSRDQGQGYETTDVCTTTDRTTTETTTTDTTTAATTTDATDQTGSTATGPTDDPTGSTATGPTDDPTGSTVTGPTDDPTGSTATGPTDDPTGSTATGPTVDPTDGTGTDTTVSTTTTRRTTIHPTIPPQEVPDHHIDNNGSACLLVSMDLNLTISYKTKDGEAQKSSFIVPMSDPDTNTTGACLGGSVTLPDRKVLYGPVMIVSWIWSAPVLHAKAETSARNEVIAFFHVDNTATTLSKVAASISLENDQLFPEADGKTATAEFDAGSMYSNEYGGSYSCSKSAELEDDSGNSLVMGNVKFEIGDDLNSDRFGEGTKCGGAGTIGLSLLVAISSIFISMLTK